MGCVGARGDHALRHRHHARLRRGEALQDRGRGRLSRGAVARSNASRDTSRSDRRVGLEQEVGARRRTCSERTCHATRARMPCTDLLCACIRSLGELGGRSYGSNRLQVLEVHRGSLAAEGSGATGIQIAPPDQSVVHELHIVFSHSASQGGGARCRHKPHMTHRSSHAMLHKGLSVRVTDSDVALSDRRPRSGRSHCAYTNSIPRERTAASGIMPHSGPCCDAGCPHRWSRRISEICEGANSCFCTWLQGASNSPEHWAQAGISLSPLLFNG